MAAAALSARLGAHREAADEYRLALRFADLHDRRTVADLHDRLSYECYLTDELADAIEERRAALALHDLEGDLERVGAAQRWLSRFSWFFGRGEDAQRYADQAIATLEGLEPGHELAMAYSNKAQLAMLSGVEDESVRWGDRAIELARAIGDHEAEAHALNNVGAALLLGSDVLAGPHPAEAESRHRARPRPPRARRPRLHEPRRCVGGAAFVRRGRRHPGRRHRLLHRPRPRFLADLHGRLARPLLVPAGPFRRGVTTGGGGAATTGSVTGQPDPGARGRGHDRRTTCRSPGRRRCWTRPGTSRRRPVRPSASCPSRWRERRPPGCAATARRWPGSWPSLGRWSTRSSPPWTGASCRGGCSVADAEGLADVEIDVALPADARGRLGRGGLGVGTRGLPVVAGGEPRPLGVAGRRPGRGRAAPVAWGPTRPAWPCCATGTKPG